MLTRGKGCSGVPTTARVQGITLLTPLLPGPSWQAREDGFAAAALNLIRLDAWQAGSPSDHGHLTHLQQLDLAAQPQPDKSTGSDRGSSAANIAVFDPRSSNRRPFRD